VTGRRKRPVLRSAAGTVLTVLLAAMVAAGAVALPTDTKLVVVASDSMRPTLRTGDLLVVPPSRGKPVEAGDIAVYRTTAEQAWVVHRVIGIRTVDERRHLLTRGDANADTDHDLVPAGNVHGTVSWRVPRLGYLLRWLAGSGPRTALGILIALVIIQETIVIFQIRRRHIQLTRPRPTTPRQTGFR
jgi:signal peptidase I